MAPNLSGIASADAARVEYLMELALDFAQAHLKPSGALLVKCFNGSSYNDILKNFRETFVTVHTEKIRKPAGIILQKYFCWDVNCGILPIRIMRF